MELTVCDVCKKEKDKKGKTFAIIRTSNYMVYYYLCEDHSKIYYELDIDFIGVHSSDIDKLGTAIANAKKDFAKEE